MLFRGNPAIVSAGSKVAFCMPDGTTHERKAPTRASETMRAMTAVKITRAELYELVWGTPMSQLAEQFGVSDVALAKTCKRLGVPHPGRGYWARVAAGQRVKRTPLAKAATGETEWTILERSTEPRPPKPEVPKVPVPADLRGSSEAIRRLGEALGSATKDQYERLSLGGAERPLLAVTVATHRRALLLLAGLAAAAEKRGHTFSFEGDGGERRLLLTAAGERLPVSVVERLEQKDHVLTAEEEKRAASGYRRGIPKYDEFAGGRLQLFMYGEAGARTSWSDTKTRTLDRQLGSIVVAAESEVHRRREHRRAEELRRKEEERRRAAEEEARLSKRRQQARAKYQEELGADLGRAASAWSDVQAIRSFLDAVREAIPSSQRSARTTAWLSWADSFVGATDPLTRVADVVRDVEPSEEELRRRM